MCLTDYFKSIENLNFGLKKNYNLEMLKFSKVYYQLKRNFSTRKDLLIAECLRKRSLLQLNGNDSRLYLQGLITNDMSHLQGSSSSIYTMFLNSKGRVLYDSLIYNAEKENTYFIECDKDGCSSLKDHLSKYKVRRKVSINCLKDELDIWTAVFNQTFINQSVMFDYKKILDLIQQNVPNVIASKDPRLPCLGLRIITPKNFNLRKEFENSIGVKIQEKNFYRLYRYKLGIGEGMQDLPFEKCFPMEANGDYLNGISFHKGCYIGQELTARTYHTGVIRKRIMPLFFQEEVELIEQGTPIFPVPPSNKPIGKLYGVEKTTGVGLLRIDEALRTEELIVLDTKCTTERPFWWPIEASVKSIKVE